MTDDGACEAEAVVERGARLRLLTLAERQNWPATPVQTLDGWVCVNGGRQGWEQRAYAWSPASVITALHSLYMRDAAGGA